MRASTYVGGYACKLRGAHALAGSLSLLCVLCASCVPELLAHAAALPAIFLAHHRETEVKQLQGWKATIEKLADQFTDLVSARTKGADTVQHQPRAEGDIEAPSHERSVVMTAMCVRMCARACVRLCALCARAC